MNVEQRQAAADLQTKPHDLGCESACRQLLTTTTITIYYYYSTSKLILSYCPTEDRRLSWPRHTGKVRKPLPKDVNHSGFYDKHNCPQCDSISGPRTLQSDMLPLDHCWKRSTFSKNQVRSGQVVITKLVSAVDGAINSLHWLVSPAISWSDTRCLPVVMPYLEIPALCSTPSTTLGMIRSRFSVSAPGDCCWQS